jgi:hypothetical protein
MTVGKFYRPYAFPQLIRYGVRIDPIPKSIRTSKPQIISFSLRLSMVWIVENISGLDADGRVRIAVIKIEIVDSVRISPKVAYGVSQEPCGLQVRTAYNPLTSGADRDADRLKVLSLLRIFFSIPYFRHAEHVWGVNKF